MDAEAKKIFDGIRADETDSPEELRLLEKVLREQLSRLAFFRRKKRKVLRTQLDELRERIARAEDRQGNE